MGEDLWELIYANYLFAALGSVLARALPVQARSEARHQYGVKFGMCELHSLSNMTDQLSLIVVFYTRCRPKAETNVDDIHEMRRRLY